MRSSSGYALGCLLFAAAASACGSSERAAPAVQNDPATAAVDPALDQEEPLPPSELETQLPPAVRDAVLKPFMGDFNAMVERRLVRAGVPYNRTFYFVDKGVQRGIGYDYGHMMEQRINERAGSGNIKVHVVFVPMAREKLLPALTDGLVDLVAGNLTITPEREKLVDFSDPTRANVNEILVTKAGTPPLASADDVAGQRVFVRKSSSYYQSLLALNKKLEAAGKAPVIIELAPENLEDDDLLEMVNAELIPAVIADDYLAKFWQKVFPGIVLHPNVVVRSNANLGVAIRKNSPQLRAALNQFMGKHGLGTAFGNQIERKYLVSTTYAKNATSEAERRKFMAVVELFRKYSGQYDLDFLLMAAQGYQESRLDHAARSHVGAIGIMQVMPATGAELKVGDIKQLEPNIHAGVKYMRKVMDTYFKDEPMDPLNRGLFTFASYNAGPGRVRQLRREAEKKGLDPSVWFGNVEQIASERIGRETVTYVSNIYKYYVAYRLVLEENERKSAARASVAGTQVK
jgi:membrane-bound lytic murein transglycosylase MltF